MAVMTVTADRGTFPGRRLVEMKVLLPSPDSTSGATRSRVSDRGASINPTD